MNYLVRITILMISCALLALVSYAGEFDGTPEENVLAWERLTYGFQTPSITIICVRGKDGRVRMVDQYQQECEKLRANSGIPIKRLGSYSPEASLTFFELVNEARFKEKLTERDLEIIELIGSGYTQEEITDYFGFLEHRNTTRILTKIRRNLKQIAAKRNISPENLMR